MVFVGTVALLFVHTPAEPAPMPIAGLRREGRYPLQSGLGMRQMTLFALLHHCCAKGISTKFRMKMRAMIKEVNSCIY
jgi:hypothetical protein